MGKVKPRTPNLDRENAFRKAKQDYLKGIYPSTRSATSAYEIPNSTLQGRLRGAQPTRIAHQKQQLDSIGRKGNFSIGRKNPRWWSLR